MVVLVDENRVIDSYKPLIRNRESPHVILVVSYSCRDWLSTFNFNDLINYRSLLPKTVLEIICHCSYIIYFFDEKDAQHQLFWLVPAVIDLPSSLLVSLLPTTDIIVVVLILAILGTLQYAIIGWLIDLALAEFNKLPVLEE